MSNTITYSSDGSKTTRPIKDAPYSIQAAWKHADSTGVAIIRVRSKRLRYEHTFGRTFRVLTQVEYQYMYLLRLLRKPSYLRKALINYLGLKIFLILIDLLCRFLKSQKEMLI